MKYELMLRSRANRRESIEEKHEKFFTRLREIPQPWGIDGQQPPTTPDCGTDIACGTIFTKLLGKGIRGEVYYQFRHKFPEDIAMYDDTVDLTFNPKKVDYKQLVCEVLPIYIEAFDGYLVRVEDDDFFENDASKEREIGLDDRHGVYRVYPVSFYDKTLCKRAFKKTPAQIADRLSGRIEDVRLLHSGVYIVGSSEPLELEVADKLCWDMKRWITE